jgi:mRNA interferase RelE/StbE
MKPHEVYLTRTADKAQRKLDKPLRLKIRDALMHLASNPIELGEALTTPLTSIFSYHLNYHGKEYRIAYQIQAEAEAVWVLLIGPHENFYRTLKNMVYGT